MIESAARRIDVNMAAARDLAALPGVDRLLARQVVLNRKVYGPFHRVRDLLRVEGMSERLLLGIADLVDVRPHAIDDTVGHVQIRPAAGAEEQPEVAEAREPVLFAGSQGSLRGTLIFRNEGGAGLHGVSVLVENTDVRGPGGAPIPAIRLPMVLAPGDQRRVTIPLEIDPTTPPGRYTADLVAGHERQRIALIVPTWYTVRIRPSTITVLNIGHDKSEFQILIQNRGNTRIAVGDVGAVPMEETDLCRVIRETVRRTEHPTWDELVGTAADQLKKTFAQFESLRVRTKNKPVTIEAGATELVVLEVQLPKSLPKRRHYRARARIFDATLTIEVQSWSQTEEEGD
jgi:Helix-hairpin-helix motif